MDQAWKDRLLEFKGVHILDLRRYYNLNFDEMAHVLGVTYREAREQYHLAKKTPRPPHWTDELSKPTRDALLYHFARKRDLITKETVKELLETGARINNAGAQKLEELRKYFDIVSDRGSDPAFRTIYVLKRLWVDDSENYLGRAMGYEEVGFTHNRRRAQALVRDAGVRVGTGWPIPKDEEVPVMKFVTLKAM